MTTGNAVKYMVEVDSKGAVTGIKAATDAADQGGQKFRVLDTVLKGVQLGMGLEIWGSFKNVIVGAVNALPALIGKVGEYAGGLLKMNSGLKLSVEAQQILMRAGDDLGLSWEKQAVAIKTMQVALAKSPEDLARLGLSWKEVKSLSPEKQYEAIGTAIANIQDPAQRTSVAVQYFGRTGQEVLGLFEGAIQTAREANEKFALAMSEGTAQSVDRLADNIELGSTAIEGWGRNFIGAIAASEPLQMVVEAILEAVGWLSREIKSNQNTITAWVTGGVVFAVNALLGLLEMLKLVADGYTGLQILLAMGIKAWKDTAAAAVFAATAMFNPLGAGKQLLEDLAANRAELDESVAAAMKGNAEWHQTLSSAQQTVNGLAEQVEAAAGATGRSTAEVKKNTTAYIDSSEATTEAAKAVARAANEYKKFSDTATGVDLKEKLGNYSKILFEGLTLTPEAIKDLSSVVDKALAAGMTVSDSGVLKVAAQHRAKQIAETLEAALRDLPKVDPFKNLKPVGPSLADIIGKEVAEAAKAVDGLGRQFDRGQIGVKEYVARMRELGQAIDAYTEKMMLLDEWAEKWSEIAATLGAVGDVLVDMGIRGGRSLQLVSEGLDVGTQAALKYASATTNAAKAAAVASVATYALKNGAVAGASAGAQFGAQWGPLGAVIGGVGGALLGWIGKAARAREEARRLAAEIEKQRAAFISSAGGIDILAAKAASAGLTLDRLFSAKTVQEYEAAVKQLNDTFELQKQANEALNAAMDRYGISINDLGPKFRQQRLDEMAMDLLRDFELLKAAGVDLNLIIEKMGPAFQEYVQKVVAGGGTIPESLRPVIEKMIEMGLLLDENGEKITDISKLKFAESMTDSVKSLIDAIKDLIAAMSGIPRVVTTEFRGQRTGDWPNGGGGEGDGDPGRGMPGFASGGIIMPRPGGLVARVAEGGQAELVAPVRAFSQQLASDLARVVGARSGGSGDMYILVDPRSGGARQISPAEARSIQNALGTGMLKVPVRATTSRVA